MFLAKTTEEVQQKLNDLKKLGTIGFVPTMGALHDGHLSLVTKAIKENSTIVVSIFVNPAQFNDPKDLVRYPRILENDLKLLEPTGCHVVFAPNVKEVYPAPDAREFNFGRLETIIEGQHRPGHFKGVAKVVSRLFEIVQPNKAYFGLKDFQQLAIIKKMVNQLKLQIKIIPCEIIREKSGLAMSSRNELLTANERRNAAIIYETLIKAKELIGQKSVQELTKWVIDSINKNSFLTVEYFEIVSDEQLQPVKSWDEENIKVGCIAALCGKVRLIDNIILN